MKDLHLWMTAKARKFVCAPNDPITPYEHDAVKHLTTFGLQAIDAWQRESEDWEATDILVSKLRTIGAACRKFLVAYDKWYRSEYAPPWEKEVVQGLREALALAEGKS